MSVLENFHVAESFKLINSSDNYNIFSELSQEETKIMRKRIIECVLATDMSFHTKQYSYVKIKKESLSVSEGQNIEKLFDGLDSVNMFATQQEFLNILLHTADISNPTKPIEVYDKWVSRLMNEFWVQGDKEKELKIPISFLCDRATTSVNKSQLGFIDGIVYPLLTTIVDFFPGLNFLLINCEQNKQIFKNRKNEEESAN